MTETHSAPIRPGFVSVVVPTRDRHPLLRDCIESLRTQTFPKDGYEIVVVDDGSSDDTSRYAAEPVRTLHPRLKYRRLEGQGLNAARNAGVEICEGEIVCFVDDDVLVQPSWLAELVSGVQRFPDADCFGGPIRLRYEGKVPRMCPSDSLGETELDLGPEDKDAEAVVGANLAIRRRALSTVGMFKPDSPLYGDEVEWQRRFKDAGGRIIYVAEASVWHRRTAADLRIPHLMRNQIRRGRSWALYAPDLGWRVSVLGALARSLREALHGVRHRCWAGFLRAVFLVAAGLETAGLLLRGGGSSWSWIPRR